MGPITDPWKMVYLPVFTYTFGLKFTVNVGQYIYLYIPYMDPMGFIAVFLAPTYSW